MGARNFIQETIDELRDAADNVEKQWKMFQAGEITKAAFEEEYTHIIRDNVIDTLQSEGFEPNNGCLYYETCPTSSYFKEEKI